MRSFIISRPTLRSISAAAFATLVAADTTSAGPTTPAKAWTSNSQDFFDFIAAFFSLLPSADFNHNGAINSQDFFDFVAAFFAGC